MMPQVATPTTGTPHLNLCVNGLLPDTRLDLPSAPARDQLLLLVEGSASLICGASRHALRPGDTVHLSAAEFQSAPATHLLAAGAGCRLARFVAACANAAAGSRRDPGVVRREEGRFFDIPSLCAMTQMAGPGIVGVRAMDLYLAEIAPGRQVAPHVHRGRDEVFLILSGRGLAFMDGREAEVGPGDLFHAPAFTPHGIANASDSPLRLVASHSPPHEEDDHWVV